MIVNRPSSSLTAVCSPPLSMDRKVTLTDGTTAAVPSSLTIPLTAPRPRDSWDDEIGENRQARSAASATAIFHFMRPNLTHDSIPRREALGDRLGAATLLFPDHTA